MAHLDHSLHKPNINTIPHISPMVFLRHFATTSRAAAKFVARTTVAPKSNTLFLVPTEISAKSVVLLATPQNIPTVIENAINLYQYASMQVLVAGVDSVVPNGARNGVSELWLDDYITFKNSVPLTAKDKEPERRESDGINAVGAKTNWKQINASLRLQLGENSVDLSLANTVFATNHLATLFYFQPPALQKQTGDRNMGEILCDLTAIFPPLSPSLGTPVSGDRWTPLTEDQNLVVTTCTGNLVKAINDGPAAKVLEENSELMSIASKETKVYVKVYRDDECKKYEVIAGGGGWGAKADLLAISPEAKLQVGDRLEFFMITPDVRFSEMNAALVSNQFMFESLPEATTYGDSVAAPQEVLSLFGCGSEMGFVLDGVNHKSPGETVSMPFSN